MLDTVRVRHTVVSGHMDATATEVLRIEPGTDESEAVRAASEVLRRGGLAAFPTETVYGIAARADDPTAMARLRAVKDRGADRAFTVHIGQPEQAASFVPDLSGLAARFCRKSWPGPLTLIVRVGNPSAAPIMARLNGSAAGAMYHKNTVGLRCPDHSVARAMLDAVGAPVVAASANLAGEAPPWTGSDVLRDLGGRIDLLIDAGRTKYAKPSTIVRVSDDRYEVVREGVYDARIVGQLATVGILFVCTGNTCRSPMAAALASGILAERLGCRPDELEPRFGVVVASAGTSGGFGGAAEHARTVLRARGHDLSAHQSRALTPELIRQADHIFAMTRAHREAILAVAPSAAERVRLLIEHEDVQDPIGGTQQEYESCAQRIEAALRARLQEISL